MSDIATATAFFEACETGKGWSACAAYCHEDAGFSCQSGALADMTALSDYANWMQGLFGPIPNARYELKGFAEDNARSMVMGFAVFHGTHSGDGGPVAATGQSTASDYVYAMQFEDGKIRHMTKIWNDGVALAELGWA